MKGVIIQGSSRSKGNTHKIASYLQERTGFDIIDLRTKNIAPFDYEFNNQNDDFIPLIREIANTYDTLIFATPVYWYAMSGIMKNFFDRITDCLKTEQETGRKLRGKSMGLVSCGSDDHIKKGFEMPFRESANYLGMRYLGSIHTWIENEEVPEVVRANLDSFLE